MKYPLHYISRSVAKMLSHMNAYHAVRQIREGKKPNDDTLKKSKKTYWFKVADIPTIAWNDDALTSLKSFFLNRHKDKVAKEGAFVPTNRKKLIEMLYKCNYELVTPLYDIDKLTIDTRNDLQVQLLALKNCTIIGHTNLRYAVLIVDSWKKDKSLTVYFAILNDQNFHATNAEPIIWREYMRIPHRSPKMHDHIDGEIELAIKTFEHVWDKIRTRAANKAPQNNWGKIMRQAIQLRTMEKTYGALERLESHGFSRERSNLLNLYALWAFAGGSFSIGDPSDKRFIPTLLDETAMDKFDGEFLRLVIENFLL